MWTLYFVYLVSAFKMLVSWAIGVSVFTAICACCNNDTEEEIEKGKIAFIKCLKGMALFVLLFTLIPSDRVLYSMFALDTMGKSDIPAKVVRILDKKLDALEKE